MDIDLRLAENSCKLQAESMSCPPFSIRDKLDQNEQKH